jgi:Flp pilus assembly protein TadG
MQRVRDERGAVAVLVALLLVPLIGFAALAIDVAGMYAERQQLQVGADAGAFAIAQDCAKGACGTPTTTAQNYATPNFTFGTATATVPTLTSSQVTVKNTATRQHWFAPVLGVNSTTLSAKATVGWGSPIGGTAVLPLAFSWCEWFSQTGGAMPSSTTERVIHFTKSSTSTCTGPSGLAVPGGFGWLTTDSGMCTATSDINSVLLSDPGASVPSTCSPTYLKSLVGRTVLLPLFDKMEGTGSGAKYHIYGYAAFTITGFYFGGLNTYNADPCKGEDRCIKGYFSKLVDTSDAFDIGAGAPSLGAAIISLNQ